MDTKDMLKVRGAAEHNLKSVDLDFPKNKLVVFTGVSGSGKSSLAFDTLYAEGQRRYVESLSSYARQFLGQMERPRYEAIRGLSPTIAIEQKSASSNPRSTVGTITEIADYLRVLFARVGEQFCHSCGRSVQSQSPGQIVREIQLLPEGTRFLLLAPQARHRKGTFAELFHEMAGKGFVRARIDGEIVELSPTPVLDKKFKHDVDIVVDRLVVRPERMDRLTDSVETALREGDGRLVVATVGDGDEEFLFSEKRYCDYCHLSFPELSPQLFSFNSPLGMCSECNGLGTALCVDTERIVPNPRLSLAEGALEAWPNGSGEGAWTQEILRGVSEGHGIDMRAPWDELPDRQRDVILSAPTNA